MINEPIIADPLHPDINQEVEANQWNTENGQTPPGTPELKPLELKPYEKFKYTDALNRGLSPTEIVDLIGSRLGMNIEKARERANGDDSIIVKSLMDKAEQAKLNVAKSKANLAGLDTDFKKGVANSLSGVAQTMNSILNSAYIRDDETYNKTKKALTKFSTDIESGIEDKDFFSMSTLGDMAGQIATLPLAVRTKTATALAEGALGFMSGYKKADTQEALQSAALGATVGVALSQVFRTLSGDHLKALNDKIKKQYLGTEDNIKRFEDFKSDYYNVVDVDNKFRAFSPTTYTKANDPQVKEASALIDFLGTEGAEIKARASEGSLLADASIRQGSQERADSIFKVLDTVKAEDLGKVNDAIGKGFDTIFDDFGRVIDSMGVVRTDNIELLKDFSEEAMSKLDEATSTDLRTLKDLLQDNTVNSLIESRKVANSLIRATSKNKRARKFKLEDLVSQIDNKILDEVGTDKYIEYKKVNEDYSKLANIRDSKVNTLIKGAQDGTITAEKALSELYKVSEGNTLFKDLDKVIGTKNTEILEKLMVKEALGTNSLDTWRKLNTQISHKGFVTPEGKALRETIQEFGKLFPIDDITQLGTGNVHLLSAGAKTNLANQGLSLLVKETFDMVQQALPWTDAYKRSAINNHFTNVLKNPTKLKQFVKVAGEISEPIKSRMVKDIVPKLTEVPQPRPGGIRDLSDPNPIDPVRKIGVDKQIVYDGLYESFKDVMFSRLDQKTRNRVVDKASDYFDKSRLVDKLKEVKGKQSDKLRQAIINGEAELMYKAIRQDAGLDSKVIDKDMMKTLVKYVVERIDNGN